MLEKVKAHADMVKKEGGEETSSAPEEDYCWPKAVRTRFATTLAQVGLQC